MRIKKISQTTLKKAKRKKKNDSGTKNKIKKIIDEKGVWGFLKIMIILILYTFCTFTYSGQVLWLAGC